MTDLATADLYTAIVQSAPPAGLLGAISARVRRYCGWHIIPELDETLVLDGSGGQCLLLPSAHVVDVTTISNDGTDIDPLDAQWTQAGIVRINGRWTDKLRGVTIGITHGWAPDAVPDVAVQVVLIAARVAASPRGESITAIGGVSVQLASTGLGLTPAEELSLAPYCIAGR
jgi:hypothetical protein